MRQAETKWKFSRRQILARLGAPLFLGLAGGLFLPASLRGNLANAKGTDDMAKTAKTTKPKKTAANTTKKTKATSKKLASNDKTGEYVILTLEGGEVKIRLRPDLAPGHVERIKTLTSEGFYDGVPFHRVIDGFMAQTGDPTGTGMGKSSYPNLKAEFSNELHRRGTVSMARSQSPDSANSQFFICFAEAPWLDGQYTVWGEVVSGMELIDALPRGVGQGGMVPEPAHIQKMTLSAQ